MCVQLSESTRRVEPISLRVGTEKWDVGNIVKSVKKSKFHQNQASDKIENEHKFIPNTGSIEQKIMILLFVEQGKNDYLFV
jgi:exoribonuclease II